MVIEYDIAVRRAIEAECEKLRSDLAAALEDRAFYSSAFAAKDDELTTAKELLQQAYECRDKLWPVGVSVRIHNFLENKNGL